MYVEKILESFIDLVVLVGVWFVFIQHSNKSFRRWFLLFLIPAVLVAVYILAIDLLVAYQEGLSWCGLCKWRGLIK